MALPPVIRFLFDRLGEADPELGARVVMELAGHLAPDDVIIARGIVWGIDTD